MRRLKLLVILLGTMSFLWWQVSSAQEEVNNNEKDVMKLKEIVVTATRTPHLLEDVPVETVVITREDIERSSAQTVSDLIRDVPGIFIRAENVPGISAWRAKIRGLDFNSGYGLVLINGQRVKGGGMGEYGIGLNQIPLEMIERIEIVKGPSSVLYGSDALAGVVNIITRSAPKRTSFGLEGAFGTHNVRIYNGWFGGQKGKIGGIINLNHEESDCGKYGYSTNRKEDYYRNRLDSNFTIGFSNNINLLLGINIEDWDRKRKYSNGVRRHTEKTKYRISPGLNVDFDDGSILKVQGYWYDWDFKTKESGGSSHFTPRNGDMSRHVIKTNSGYLQDEINFGLIKPVTVVLGGRFDDNSTFGGEFCPKASLMIEATKETRIHGSVGRGFKSPNIRQLYYNQPFHHGTYWFKSNPDLDAEKSWGYSLGIEQYLGKRCVLGLDLFRNDIKDKVVWVESNETIYGEPVKTAKNIGKCYTQGIEVSLKARLTPEFSTVFGYTYMDTEDEERHKELTYGPKNTFTARFTYEYVPWSITGSIGTQYVGEMYKDTNNTKKTDDYFLTNIKVSKEVTKYAAVSIEGNNIFNSNYGEPERDWADTTWLVRLKIEF